MQADAGHHPDAVAAAHDHQRVVQQIDGEIVADVGNLRDMPDRKPFPTEYLFNFQVEEGARGIGRGRKRRGVRQILAGARQDFIDQVVDIAPGISDSSVRETVYREAPFADDISRGENRSLRQ